MRRALGRLTTSQAAAQFKADDESISYMHMIPTSSHAHDPQRAEVGAMLAVTAVAVGTLVQSATAEPMASEPAATAEYGPSGSLLHHALLKRVASEIRDGQVVVLDGVLDKAQLAAARGDVGRLHDGGRFSANANDDEANRRDEVLWVTGREEGLGAGLSHAVALLRGLAHELGRSEAFGNAKLFVQTGAQLACYAGDGRAHYAAHRDASDESVWSMGLNAWLRARPYRERAVTAILYLNETAWDTQKQGGSLRCYQSEQESAAAETSTSDSKAPLQQLQQQASHTDVAPRGGRLVLFDSKAVLHEVLPSHQPRQALTVWISDRAARLW